MKRLMIAAAMVVFAACGGADTTTETTVAEKPLAGSKNSAEFNAAFGNLMQRYYHLKDALVLSNDTLANSTAANLAATADSLDFQGVQADSSIRQMAGGYVQTIAAEAKALQGEKDLEAKRRSFQLISASLYDLVRTVQYDRAVVYHQYCPMAFNDEGAYWLSSSADIKNPYFGKKMLTCGEVKDSLAFMQQ